MWNWLVSRRPLTTWLSHQLFLFRYDLGVIRCRRCRGWKLFLNKGGLLILSRGMRFRWICGPCFLAQRAYAES